jgi:hypothetical protein
MDDSAGVGIRTAPESALNALRKVHLLFYSLALQSNEGLKALGGHQKDK